MKNVKKKENIIDQHIFITLNPKNLMILMFYVYCIQRTYEKDSLTHVCNYKILMQKEYLYGIRFFVTMFSQNTMDYLARESLIKRSLVVARSKKYKEYLQVQDPMHRSLTSWLRSSLLRRQRSLIVSKIRV